MEKLRIVFMGTPEFAVGILDTIIKNNYNVVGVITAADKPAGRGQKIKYSAVKEYALANNLSLLQPTNLKDETFLQELKALNASGLENARIRHIQPSRFVVAQLSWSRSNQLGNYKWRYKNRSNYFLH